MRAPCVRCGMFQSLSCCFSPVMKEKSAGKIEKVFFFVFEFSYCIYILFIINTNN